MELIVAVYDDWGIGRDGTQPVALKADRKFRADLSLFHPKNRQMEKVCI